MNNIINTLLIILATLCAYLGYRVGLLSKENSIIKNNNNLKKKYAKNKNHINDSNALSDKLQNGKY